MKHLIKDFMDKVAENAELKAKLDALSEIPEDQRVDTVIAIAKAAGIALTSEDFAQPTNEMNDDELEAVAGGDPCYCLVGGGGVGNSYDSPCGCVLGGGGAAFNQVRCACPVLGYGD